MILRYMETEHISQIFFDSFVNEGTSLFLLLVQSIWEARILKDNLIAKLNIKLVSRGHKSLRLYILLDRNFSYPYQTKVYKLMSNFTKSGTFNQ